MVVQLYATLTSFEQWQSGIQNRRRRVLWRTTQRRLLIPLWTIFALNVIGKWQRQAKGWNFLHYTLLSNLNFHVHNFNPVGARQTVQKPFRVRLNSYELLLFFFFFHIQHMFEFWIIWAAPKVPYFPQNINLTFSHLYVFVDAVKMQ